MANKWIEVKENGLRPESQYVWLYDGDMAILLPNAGEYLPWAVYTHYMEADIVEPEAPVK